MIYNCSGCSKSGIKQRSDSNKAKPTVTKPPQENISENETIRNQTKTKLTLNLLFKKHKESVFMIFTSDGEKGYQGSGFFVSDNGVAISNYHVFEGTSKGLEIIRTAEGKELKVEEVLDYNKEKDYIIFKVSSGLGLKYIPIPIAENQPEIGEDVFAIGNPYELEHTLSTGIVSGYRNNDKWIQTTTEITHGSSGGPLLNMKGEVVGITTSGLGEANLNFALNILEVPVKRHIRN